MSWFKLDDQAYDHPKFAKAGNEAIGAWCRAGMWCSKHLTDGVVPREVAFAIAPEPVWRRLVECRLLDPHRDGWAIHDYLDWNPSRAEVLAERERKAKALGKHRKKSISRAPQSPEEIDFTPVTSAGRNGAPVPVPVPISPPPPPPARASSPEADVVRSALEGDTLLANEDLGPVADRIGKRLHALPPEERWGDLAAEVAEWLSSARKAFLSAKDAGQHWSGERLLAEVEGKAVQRIRYRPKDARMERERERSRANKWPDGTAKSPAALETDSLADEIAEADRRLAEERRKREAEPKIDHGNMAEAAKAALAKFTRGAA